MTEPIMSFLTQNWRVLGSVITGLAIYLEIGRYVADWSVRLAVRRNDNPPESLYILVILLWPLWCFFGAIINSLQAVEKWGKSRGRVVAKKERQRLGG